MTQYSLQMYTLREFMKTPEALDRTLSRVAEMGYENVQITPPAFTTAAELAKLLKTKGLKADSAIASREYPSHSLSHRFPPALPRGSRRPSR